jgi:hypothetical protein
VSTLRFVLPAAVVAETKAHLKAKGAIGHEGVVLWRGSFEPPRITAAIIPEQQTGPGRFIVPLAERQRIARSFAGTGEMIVAQVHSHPGAAFHSPTDDAEAIPRRAGSYSLVIADFGHRAGLLDGAALFQLSDASRWEQIPTETFTHAQARRGVVRWLIDTLKSFGRSRI